MSLQMLMALFDDDSGIPDVVSLPATISLQGGSPESFVISADGSRTSGTWESANNPTPVDTYHVKWEDHGTHPNPATTPFAKSTWTQLTGAGPFTWTHTDSPPNISTRGIELFISNDGGSTTLDSSLVTLTVDESP